ncbi:MAG: hypothetical protein ACREDR_44545, partial [Blastocatellia bacterium]
GPGSETKGQSGPIRSIDFKNFTYHPSCLNPEGDAKAEAIRTVDGVYSRGDATDPNSDKVYFEVRNVIYGDLSGDGQEKAVVTTLCNTGGTGQFSDGIIFGIKSGKAVQIATVGAGDRADGGIYSVRIENSLLKVERYGQEHSGACCPEYIETTTLRLNGTGLVEVGKATRRPYKEDQDNDGQAQKETGRAAKPIHFERGRSSSQIKGSTVDDDNYTIQAKAGQTMIVSVTSVRKNASVSVVGEDETPIDGDSNKTGWTGKLPYSGKYRIVVHATSGTAAYTLEVAIR